MDSESWTTLNSVAVVYHGSMALSTIRVTLALRMF